MTCDLIDTLPYYMSFLYVNHTLVIPTVYSYSVSVLINCSVLPY